jgi:hypothetical protein
VLEAPIQDSSPETGGYGLLGRSILLSHRDRLGRPFSVRAVEAAGRVAVARGDASGVQLGADPAERSVSERGKRPGGARRAFGLGAGAPSAVAVGAWRRTRSSRGSHAPPGRAGKPPTGRRGPVSQQHDWLGRRSPVNTGAPLSSGYFTTSARCRSGSRTTVTLCAHGEPDAVEIASPVRRAAARRPPADKAGTGASPPTLRAASLPAVVSQQPVGCAERTTRRWPAVTATQSTSLPQALPLSGKGIASRSSRESRSSRGAPQGPARLDVRDHDRAPSSPDRQSRASTVTFVRRHGPVPTVAAIAITWLLLGQSGAVISSLPR